MKAALATIGLGGTLKRVGVVGAKRARRRRTAEGREEAHLTAGRRPAEEDGTSVRLLAEPKAPSGPAVSELSGTNSGPAEEKRNSVTARAVVAHPRKFSPKMSPGEAGPCKLDRMTV